MLSRPYKAFATSPITVVKTCKDGINCSKKGPNKDIPSATQPGGKNLFGVVGNDPVTDQLQKSLGLDKKGAASVGDSAKCKGCVNTGDFGAYLGCLAMKAGCESQAVGEDLFGDFGKYAVPIGVGIGLIVLILVVK